MQSGVRFFLLGVAGALMLAASPAALGGGDQPTLVALAQAGSNFTLTYETLNGTVTRSVAAPPNVDPSNFVSAANGSIVFTNGSPGPLWLIHPDGSAEILDSSPDDYDPSISYDGSKVVFGRGHGTTSSSDLYVINTDGSGLRQIVAGGATNSLDHPVFSPDGGSIAYWCGPATYPTNAAPGCGPLTDGTYRQGGVMRVGADGSNPRMILIGAGDALDAQGPSYLSWSPDGREILLDGAVAVGLGNGSVSTEHQLFAYRADGSDLFNNRDASRQITHEAYPYPAFLGQFCGSSTLVYFVKTVDDQGNQGNFSYTINRDGTARQELFLSTANYARQWGTCVLPATGQQPPPIADMTHVTVPSLHALGVKAAKARLLAANLSLGKMRHRYSAKVARNRVVAQRPRAGAVAHRTRKKGPPVRLVVSRGPKPKR